MSQTREGRGGTRGQSQRGQSNGLRLAFRDTGAVRLSLASAAKVHRAADTVREKAQNHYDKHRDSMIARQYTRLLLKSGPMLSLNPPGMSVDPKIALMNRARNDVQRAQSKRLQTIETARKSLLNTGRIRETRKIEWGAKPSAAAKGAEQGRQQQPGRDDAKSATATRTVSRSTMARISVAQDRARRRVEAHHTKHQEKWTTKRYQSLTAKFDMSKSKLSATDAQHVREVALEAASRSVTAKHEARLQRIDVTCDRMRATGNIRASRPVGRNLGLGE